MKRWFAAIASAANVGEALAAYVVPIAPNQHDGSRTLEALSGAPPPAEWASPP